MYQMKQMHFPGFLLMDCGYIKLMVFLEIS